MKTLIKTILLVSVLILLTTCSLPNSGNNAVITINLGSRSGWLHEEDHTILDKLIFRATFSSDEHDEIFEKVTGRKPISVTVAPGLWYILLEAELNGELYATNRGENFVRVAAGQRIPVTINMYSPDDSEKPPIEVPIDLGKTEYDGIIYDFNGSGIIHAYYGKHPSSIDNKRNNIGTVTSGRFSFNISNIPVNNLFSLYDFVNFNYIDGITSDNINVDNNVKYQVLLPVIIKNGDTSGGFFEYALEESQDFNTTSFLIYVDTAVTVKGTRTNSGGFINNIDIYDMTLPKGWSMIYFSQIWDVDGVNSIDVTSKYTSNRPVEGYTWKLRDTFEPWEYILNDEEMIFGWYGTYVWQEEGRGDFPVGKWMDNPDNHVLEFKADNTFIHTFPDNFTEKAIWYIDTEEEIIYLKFHGN